MNRIKINDKDIDYMNIIKDFDGRKTGWGETEIDILYFSNQYPLDIQDNKLSLKRLLNQIYRVLIDKEHEKRENR